MADDVRRPHPILWLYLVVVAIITGLTGLVLAGGGAWLLSLGGSWYYLVAGIGLVASAYFLLRGPHARLLDLSRRLRADGRLGAVGARTSTAGRRCLASRRPAVLLSSSLIAHPRAPPARPSAASPRAHVAPWRRSQAILALGLAGLAEPLVDAQRVVCAGRGPCDDRNRLPGLRRYR